jgi:glycosyltransferase involved in cell wall biosynthesis
MATRPTTDALTETAAETIGDGARTRPSISVILPVYEEEENISRVFDGDAEDPEDVLHPLFAELEKLGLPYEVIAVDDGSTDRTFEHLRAYQRRHPALRLIRFRRNFGQTAALAAGFDAARGEVFVTMDADGQNDPSNIGRLLEVMTERDADVVSGWRHPRCDSWTRRLPSMLANRLISKVTGVDLHDYGCTLKAYRRSVIEPTRLYGEMHRFIPALAHRNGARVCEIKVTHHERKRGTSKYGISRTGRVILDLLTVKFLASFGTRPIHMFGSVGSLSLLAGLGIGAYLVFIRLVLQESIADRPLLLGAVLLVLIGLQFISMGLISELLVRIYHESSDRPIYQVREILEPEEPPLGRPRTSG